MKNKFLIIMLIVSVTIFMFIFPYTKQVKVFRTDDITWETLKISKSVNEFDPKKFNFIKNQKISEDAEKLNNRNISIKGFFKILKHEKNIHFVLTETVTDVCFMCNHDEHHNLILLKNAENIKSFKNLKDDTLINIRGKLNINLNPESDFIFSIDNPKIVN